MTRLPAALLLGLLLGIPVLPPVHAQQVAPAEAAFQTLRYWDDQVGSERYRHDRGTRDGANMERQPRWSIGCDTMMDLAWALFEIRVHRDSLADANAVWAAITSEYPRILPHPEWPWWAMRGQLIDAPGYLLNYALGAFITADIRARIVALRGPLTAADAGFYSWMAERLYEYGLARPSRGVLEEFVGRSLSPDALLTDLARMTP